MPTHRPLAAAVVVTLLTACSPASPAPTASAPAASATVSTPSATPTPAPVAENSRPGTREWELADADIAGERDLGGYTDKVSALPGEPVGLYLTSSLGAATVSAYRVGDYGGTGGRLVWRSQPVNVPKQPAPVVEADRLVTTHWAKTLDLDTRDWPDGAYLLKVTAGGKGKYVPFVVRTPSAAGRVVLVSAVATFQAYNQWGDWSLFGGVGDHRAGRVSFDRPQTGTGAPWFMADERPVIQLAESLGIPLAYTTNVDLDRDTNALAGATGVVSQGHDEYWTLGMRERVENARDAGTDVAFLGANAVYWRIRLEPGTLGDRRTLVGYKGSGDPVKDAPTTTNKWRSAPHPRPENSLTGMLYECFPAYGPFVVQAPDSFLFAGTGATKGTAIPGVMGTEVDRVYPRADNPPTLQIVGHTPLTCEGSKKATYADSTYYTTAHGSFVFATGSQDWVHVLWGPNPKRRIDATSIAFVTTVTSNVLREMAKPLGHAPPPAVPNVAELKPAASTGTGTGGSVAG